MTRNMVGAILVTLVAPGAALAQTVPADTTPAALARPAAPAPALAPAPDSSKSDTNFWLAAGVGLSSLGSLGGVASVNVQRRRLLFSARATANEQCVSLFCGGDELFDTALLVGVATLSPDDPAHASFALGVARVTGSRFIDGPGFFGGGRAAITPSLGLAADAQVDLRLGGGAGLALDLYLDINREASFAGFTLGLELGKLR